MKRMKPFLPQKELNNFILEVNDNIYLQSLLLDADEEIFTEINNFSQNENQMLKFLDSFLTVYRYGPRNYEFYFDVLLKSVEALKRYFSSDFLVHFFHEQIKIVLFLYEHECITIRSIAIKYLDNNLMNQFFKNKLSVQDVMNCISSKCALTADDLNSRIIQLIEKDDVIEFQKLVSETNFDLNSRFTILDISKHFSNYKPSILDYAVFCSSINLVKFLLLQNVEMTFKLPIFAACCSNYEIIHILEDHKIPFDIESLNTSIQFHKNDIYKYLKNKYDIKPTKDSLLVSVLSHNYEVFIELFNLYLPDDVYYNAFHIASQYSNYSVIKLLCKYCNIFRTYYQMTPLSLAVSNGAIHIVELMLQNGKPLSFESELFLFNITHKIAFQSYYEDLIKLLIDVENCNIMKKDSQDWTLLHHAAELNLYNIVELLLQKPNIEINAVTYQGSTPLIIACSRNNFEIVKLLIDNKADINIKPKNGVPF